MCVYIYLSLSLSLFLFQLLNYDLICPLLSLVPCLSSPIVFTSISPNLSPLLCYLPFSFIKQGIFVRYYSLVPHSLLFLFFLSIAFITVDFCYCYSSHHGTFYMTFPPTHSIIPSHFSPPNPSFLPSLPSPSPFPSLTLMDPRPPPPPLRLARPCQVPSSKFMCRGPISVRSLYFNLTVSLGPRTGD